MSNLPLRASAPVSDLPSNTGFGRRDSSVARASAERPHSAGFRQFVLKIHSRCNLACDYCYVYEMADQSWRDRPRLMAPATVIRVAERISEHAAAHGLRQVDVVLHGGEPLLAGTDFLAFAAEQLRAAVGATTQVEISLQTNGVLLTPSMLDLLLGQRIGVSVSVDGAEPDHDRHRRYPNGRGSFRAVAEGIERLRAPAYRALFRGLLCTVNLDHDPIETYEALAEFGPPRIDFLLPHGTWSQPPPGRPDDATTPYADWLRVAFDRWYGAAVPETDIRFFREIIHLLLGGVSGAETIGLTPSTLVVVETDGSIEQVDALKSAYAGAAETGLDVHHNDFDQAMKHPSIVARRIGVAALADQCRSCRLLRICGGGFYPHRYRADPRQHEPSAWFANPSVYCADLMALIDHIRARLQSDLSRSRSQP